MSKILKLKNYFLVDIPEPNKIASLQIWLNDQLLHGKVSRHRTRFIKLVIPRAEEIEKEKNSMLEKLADKKKVKDKEMVVYLDDKGKDTTDQKLGKRYKLSAKNHEEFTKQYNDYLNEDYIIDVTPANREDIYGVRDLLLNTNAEFSQIQATRYNEWAEAFEDIKEDKGEKKVEKILSHPYI